MSLHDEGRSRGPSLARYLLIALAIAVVIRATMGAPAHEAGGRGQAPWSVAKSVAR